VPVFRDGPTGAPAFVEPAEDRREIVRRQATLSANGPQPCPAANRRAARWLRSSDSRKSCSASASPRSGTVGRRIAVAEEGKKKTQFMLFELARTAPRYSESARGRSPQTTASSSTARSEILPVPAQEITSCQVHRPSPDRNLAGGPASPNGRPKSYSTLPESYGTRPRSASRPVPFRTRGEGAPQPPDCSNRETMNEPPAYRAFRESGVGFGVLRGSTLTASPGRQPPVPWRSYRRTAKQFREPGVTLPGPPRGRPCWLFFFTRSPRRFSAPRTRMLAKRSLPSLVAVETHSGDFFRQLHRRTSGRLRSEHFRYRRSGTTTVAPRSSRASSPLFTPPYRLPPKRAAEVLPRSRERSGSVFAVDDDRAS